MATPSAHQHVHAQQEHRRPSPSVTCEVAPGRAAGRRLNRLAPGGLVVAEGRRVEHHGRVRRGCPARGARSPATSSRPRAGRTRRCADSPAPRPARCSGRRCAWPSVAYGLGDSQHAPLPGRLVTRVDVALVPAVDRVQVVQHPLERRAVPGLQEDAVRPAAQVVREVLVVDPVLRPAPGTRSTPARAARTTLVFGSRSVDLAGVGPDLRHRACRGGPAPRRCSAGCRRTACRRRSRTRPGSRRPAAAGSSANIRRIAGK